VLVVDDEDLLRSAIRRSLQAEGDAVLEAQNGAMALELMTASEHRPRQRSRTDPEGSEV